VNKQNKDVSSNTADYYNTQEQEEDKSRISLCDDMDDGEEELDGEHNINDDY
jgi:hypothetical protein